jgi:PAS domain-containing protein
MGNLQGMTVGAAMSATPIVLVPSDRPSAMAALTICQQHQIRHLPILDDRQQLVGMVTLADIHQILLEAIARSPQSPIEPAVELERIDRQLLPATISSHQVEAELERRVRERTAALERRVRQLQAEIVQQQYQPAARSLQQSKRKFRAIFDGIFQFIGLLDTDGIVLEANQTALAAIGATAAQIVGQVFWETPWWTHSPDLQRRLQQTGLSLGAAQLLPLTLPNLDVGEASPLENRNRRKHARREFQTRERLSEANSLLRARDGWRTDGAPGAAYPRRNRQRGEPNFP